MQRAAERSILTPDVRYLLKNGFVYEDAVPAKSRGYFRYVVQGTTPNSDSRQIAAVVIPNAATMSMKIVTLYWVDEETTKAGTSMEGPK
ncbi:DUF4258 domain-containing protein [Celeribacter sp.]|uniref:DUF4258 domain-containing protein n=1 Tax=Celeribacter sp. TaxID=1890673 RepID=UPI003A8ECE4C